MPIFFIHSLQGVLRGKPVAIKNIPMVIRRDGQIDEHTSEVLEDFRNECAVMRFSPPPPPPRGMMSAEL